MPLILFLALVFITLNTQAEVKIIDSKDTQATLNSQNCEPHCALKEFRLVEEKKRVVPPKQDPNMPFFMTDIRAVYTTEKTEQIEDYAIVQWIEGCVFDSKLENGKVVKWSEINREFFDKVSPFKHIGFEIDSDSTDPIYTSHRDYGRHAILRWNKNPKNLDAEKAIFWANSKPPHSTVFATDLPGAAYVNELVKGKVTEARNASLFFKTCIFKTSDLPIATTPKGENIDSDKAIACLEWDHNFVFNYSKQKFESPKQVDPFCKIPVETNNEEGLILPTR